MKVVLDAGSEITFKVGGSFVKLDPSGVTLVGPSVNINAGGSPGSGSGAAPVLPVAPLSADTAPVGESTGRANVNPLALPDEGEPGPKQLIVDVWGDPELGNQIQLLDPEDDA